MAVKARHTIRHGDEDNIHVFHADATVTGLSDEDMEALWDAGALYNDSDEDDEDHVLIHQPVHTSATHNDPSFREQLNLDERKQASDADSVSEAQAKLLGIERDGEPDEEPEQSEQPAGADPKQGEKGKVEKPTPEEAPNPSTTETKKTGGKK